MANMIMGEVASSSEMQNETGIEIVISPQRMPPPSDLPSREVRDRYLTICVPLYQAALKGDWRAAKGVIEVYPWVVRASITKGGETALHIAATARRTHFVQELVKLMNPEDLELQNQNKNTALCFAAAEGIVQIAKVMIAKNEKLPRIRGSQGMTPLHMASLLGHSCMVWYLYNKTNDQDLEVEDRIGILNKCISAGLYDVALDMLQHHPMLAVARDGNGETALHVLAKKPAFAECQLQMWEKYILSIPGMKFGKYKYPKHIQALELVRRLWQHVVKLDESEILDLIRSPSRLLFDAAELGNIKFLIELIRSYPDLIWEVDNHNRSIFHIAVLHRHANIFSLIYEIPTIKDWLTSYRDKKGNNMLHLAAKLPPPNEVNVVAGAARQMRRDLLWFQEVEKIVQPYCTKMKNKKGETPWKLFTEEHKGLVKEGEKWMRNTASQTMVVAALVATVTFAAAFTVPGGNNNDTGTPIFVKNRNFMYFAISDAIALFASSASMLTLLSLHTSRYAEKDFLVSLPSKLRTGLLALSVSISFMMGAFAATFHLIYLNDFKWVRNLITVLASMAGWLFLVLLYDLFVDKSSSTYGFRLLFKPRKPMLY